MDGNGGADSMFGGAGSDTMMGSTGDDVMDGGGDNDVMSGNLGNDIMTGSTGDDVMDGGGGNDTMSGNGGSDVMSGDIGDDVVTGNIGVDTISGGDGADVLTGSGGNDSIDAGGSDGAVDTVVFNATGDGADSVTGFDTTGTDDLIGIGGALHTALDDVTVDSVLTFGQGDGVNATATAVDLATVEALILGNGNSNEGVTDAALGSAISVAAEFNEEFAITSAVGQDALLAISATDSDDFSVWVYEENGTTAGIQAGELTLLGVVDATDDALTSNIALV
jgi:Ca2+-binding RTX toxin-like protein